MAKEHKGRNATRERADTMGRHDGNRAAGHDGKPEQPKHSSQSAGKDPHRGTE